MNSRSYRSTCNIERFDGFYEALSSVSKLNFFWYYFILFERRPCHIFMYMLRKVNAVLIIFKIIFILKYIKKLFLISTH
jgi:hypothetical protein